MKNLLTLAFILSSPLVSAQSINYEIACPNGGIRSITGEYAPITGIFKLQTLISNCSNIRNKTSNGSVSANGVFKPTKDNKFNIDAQIISAIKHSGIDDEDVSSAVEHNCERTISGVYDPETNNIQGSSTNSCEKSGNIYAPILELVSGMGEQQSFQENGKLLEPQSKVAGSWVNCQNNPDLQLDIRADGSASYSTDVTETCIGVMSYDRYIGYCKSLSDEMSIIDVAIRDLDKPDTSIFGSKVLLDEPGIDNIECNTRITP